MKFILIFLMITAGLFADLPFDSDFSDTPEPIFPALTQDYPILIDSQNRLAANEVNYEYNIQKVDESTFPYLQVLTIPFVLFLLLWLQQPLIQKKLTEENERKFEKYEKYRRAI